MRQQYRSLADQIRADLPRSFLWANKKGSLRYMWKKAAA